MTIVNSILAGILIGLGGFAYASIGGPLGAVIFSLGLLSVLVLKADLYTGKVCFVNQKPVHLLAVLFFNYAGACLVAFITTGLVDTSDICAAKLADPKAWLLRSIMCGIFIGVAVRSWERYKSELIVIFAVVGFILTGSEHVIANIYYFSVAGMLGKIISLKFIATCLLGNTAGGCLIALLMYLKEELDKDGNDGL